MRRTKLVIIQNIPDELWNREAKTCLKVLDIEGHLARRWVVNLTLGPRGEELELLRDTVLLLEPFDVCRRKRRNLHLRGRSKIIGRVPRLTSSRRGPSYDASPRKENKKKIAKEKGSKKTRADKKNFEKSFRRESTETTT